MPAMVRPRNTSSERRRDDGLVDERSMSLMGDRTGVNHPMGKLLEKIQEPGQIFSGKFIFHAGVLQDPLERREPNETGFVIDAKGHVPPAEHGRTVTLLIERRTAQPENQKSRKPL